MLADFLKTSIPYKISESEQFESVEDTLLISVPNAQEDGLVMLQNGKLFRFALSGCAGLYLSGNQLFVSIVSPDCMTLRVYEPGQPAKTIISSKLGDVHDLLVRDNQLYVVSTGTNEVAIVNMDGSISKSWMMNGFGDSWHVNCLDVWDGKLVASAFGKFATYRGYKGHTVGAGIIFDVATQETLFDGLSKPHSPRRDQGGAVYVCDSRAKGINYMYQEERKSLTFPGSFPRGMAITDDKIYIGLSSLRVGEDGAEQCIPTAQVAIVDRERFQPLKTVSLPQAEIYDVVVLRN